MGLTKAEIQERRRLAGTTKRLRFGLVVLLALMLVLGGRLFVIQAVDPDGLAQAALQSRLRTVPIAPLRGDIVDAKGNVLATSVERFDITVDQRQVKDRFQRSAADGSKTWINKDQAVTELARALGQDEDNVRTSITGDDPYRIVARSVSPAVRKKVQVLGIPGIYDASGSKRVYPAGQVAGSIIGFLGSDGQPLAGLEETQDKKLEGTAGKKTYEIGADGARIPFATNEVTPAVNGQTVKLTINEDIQWYAQQQIASQVKRLDADWGNIVIIEAKTGRIVAMAESTTPDPNNPGATPAQFRQPLSVTAAFEPGSTEKMITFSAAIQEGLVTPLSHVLVPPTYTIDGQTFSDAFDHGTQKRTVAGIVGMSMNTGTVMVGSRLTKQQRYDYLKKFGIGEKTHTGLPGESAGILSKPETWDGRQEYTVLFGQGVAQTALQTAMAYQTIANNGVRLKPRLIDAYIDPDGTEHKVPTKPGTRVVSPKTAHQVQRLLETVVTNSGATQAAMDTYRLGGKTGTAEAPGPNGGYNGYTASFVGMGPMEDPQYVVGVTLQRPKGDIYGVTAAPTFKAVMGRLLTVNDVPPSTTKPVELPLFYK